MISYRLHIVRGFICFILNLFFYLKDNFFTERCAFLSYINKNQPEVHPYPVPSEPPIDFIFIQFVNLWLLIVVFRLFILNTNIILNGMLIFDNRKMICFKYIFMNLTPIMWFLDRIHSLPKYDFLQLWVLWKHLWPLVHYYTNF